MKVRVLQGVKLDANTLLQAGQEWISRRIWFRSRPDLFRSIEDPWPKWSGIGPEPVEAAQARYEAHMAQRAQLRAGEDEAIRARAAQLAEQARRPRACGRSPAAGRAAPRGPARGGPSFGSPVVSQSAQPPSLSRPSPSRHKRNRKDS